MPTNNLPPAPSPSSDEENYGGLKYFSEAQNRRIFLACLAALILVLLVLFFKPGWQFASGLMGAITLFALLRGQMRALTEKHKWKRGFAASLLLFEALFFFLIPLGGIVAMLIDVFSNNSIDFNAWYIQIKEWTKEAEEWLGIELLTSNNLSRLTSLGQRVTTVLLSNVYSMLINSVVLLFLLFYMLYQRHSFECTIRELLPFSEQNKHILITESKRIIVANAIGIPLLAIVQGIFAYIGYLIFGVQTALFYAVLTALSTIIPVVGTMVVWIPLGVVFAIHGEWGLAIGLLLYGFIIIGGVDNVARFLLQKRLADIHPLITIFGVIFGLSLFGFWGVIFGPLLLSILILLLNMLRHDYIQGSTAEPRVTTSFTSQNNLKKVTKILEKKKK